MSMNLWSSLMCTLALIIGLGLFFKQLDMLLMNEIKAMLTVTFGFAASCLILSFIWILQKRPIDAHHLILSTSIGELPSLHPNGAPDRQRRDTICSITSKLDLPPNYEDALINSKVISRSDYLTHEKEVPHEEDHNHYSHAPAFTICLNESRNHENIGNINGSGFSGTNSGKGQGNSVTHLASSIVRGFATFAPLNQFANHRRSGNNDQQQQLDNSHSRKISYCQLDVDQLMLSASPPKFSELMLDGESSGLSNHCLSSINKIIDE